MPSKIISNSRITSSWCLPAEPGAQQPPLGAGRGQATRGDHSGAGGTWQWGACRWDLVQPHPRGGPQTPSTGALRPTARLSWGRQPGLSRWAQASHPGACKVTTSIITPIPSPEFWTLRSAVFTGTAPASPPTKASRTKSPGPARRLSMKMKKLPELRRRLSLRSTRTSRERERAAPEGSVISRYHLDSSVGTPGRTAESGAIRLKLIQHCKSTKLLYKIKI